MHMPDTYFALVKQFPLTHLRDDDHLDAAQGVIDQLVMRDLDEGEQNYLDVLTDLVESYEHTHIEIPAASEADVLRALMESNGLSQARLAKRVGISQSTISSVLNSTRSLTKEQVITLAKEFRLSPLVFLPLGS